MHLFSVAQMVEVDRLTITVYGVTLLQLMENAGRSLAVVARRMAGGSGAGRKVVRLIGKGNNGGGGLVAARHLANAGAAVTVALSEPPDELGEAPEQQRGILRQMGVAGSEGRMSLRRLTGLLVDANLLVDALIGYGLRDTPREPVASFIRAANAAKVPRLALDLPSGLDGDHGRPLEPCLRADVTLTLAWPKAGLLTSAARPFVGELYLADIGIPTAVYRAVRVEPGTVFTAAPIVRVRPLAGGWEPADGLEELK